MSYQVKIAKENVGKYIDCYKRMFGSFPMQIIQTKGKEKNIVLKDSTGTCMRIEDEGFNAKSYDYMFTMEEENERN